MSNEGLQKTNSGARIDFLEGLRGFLASWVMIGHVGCFTAVWPSNSNPVLKLIGWFDLTPGHAVSVFMILSGFVISFLLARQNESYGAFIFRRFFRLWPVFMIGLAMGVALNSSHQFIHAFAPWSDDQWIKQQLEIAQADRRAMGLNILFHIPMLHGAIPDPLLPFADSAFLGPAWSMSTEWQFYLVAPFLFLMGRRLLGFFGFTFLALFCLFAPTLFPGFYETYPMRSFLPNQLPWFYLGIISFYFYSGYAGFRESEAKVCRVVSGVMAALILLRGNHWLPGMIWVVFFSLAVMPPRLRQFAAPKFLLAICNSRWAQYLGSISYPIYVLHWPIQILVSRVELAFFPHIGRGQAYMISLIAVPTLTILIGHFVHSKVEAPVIEWARKLARSWRKSAKPAPAGAVV